MFMPAARLGLLLRVLHHLQAGLAHVEGRQGHDGQQDQHDEGQRERQSRRRAWRLRDDRRPLSTTVPW